MCAVITCVRDCMGPVNEPEWHAVCLLNDWVFGLIGFCQMGENIPQMNSKIIILDILRKYPMHDCGIVLKVKSLQAAYF